VQEPTRLSSLAGASFAASFLSACLSVGGGYISFGATTWIPPSPSAIASQSVSSFGSSFSRTHAFWADIDWAIVRTFTAGSSAGVAGGMWSFSRAPENSSAILSGVSSSVSAWSPPLRSRISPGKSFFSVGVSHAVVGTSFGLGAILQPASSRTKSTRTAIVGTFASCIIVLEVSRTAGYS
ncbi:hypothetical protein OY671_009259, partial [Metschnikowia pulcherrima]